MWHNIAVIFTKYYIYILFSANSFFFKAMFQLHFTFFGLEFKILKGRDMLLFLALAYSYKKRFDLAFTKANVVGPLNHKDKPRLLLSRELRSCEIGSNSWKVLLGYFTPLGRLIFTNYYL